MTPAEYVTHPPCQWCDDTGICDGTFCTCPVGLQTWQDTYEGVNA